MRSRPVVALAILLAWVGGLGMLVRREYFRPHLERLAEAALRVSPAAIFYAVMQGDQQVGFASSTIDTTMTTIEQRDYLVADIPAGGTMHRAEVRTNVVLSRTLRLRSFEMSMEAEQAPLRVLGEVEGDTTLMVVVQQGEARPDTQRIALTSGILLPTLVPLALALDDRPRVGKSYILPVFDPGSLQNRDMRIDVRAESLFVVNDSSVFDSTSGRWFGVLPDTVRAWEIVSPAGSGIGGWVDERGRLVATSQMGFRLQRMPYEVAFENWRRQADTLRHREPARVTADRDIIETSAIAANRHVPGNVSRLRVRLRGVDLDGFDLAGGRQRLAGDTLVIEREDQAMLAARYSRLRGAERSGNPNLRAEQFLEVGHPEIVELAERLAGDSRQPHTVARRISRWVHDSIAKEVMIGIPSALHVLHTRRGDCNEHSQLFVALARAAGLPARVSSGLVYVDGKFYYHAWAEVMLHGWVAVDPTFDQFPADAAHVRFVAGGLGRQTELLRLIGNLQIDVLAAR